MKKKIIRLLRKARCFFTSHSNVQSSTDNLNRMITWYCPRCDSVILDIPYSKEEDPNA